MIFPFNMRVQVYGGNVIWLNNETYPNTYLNTQNHMLFDVIRKFNSNIVFIGFAELKYAFYIIKYKFEKDVSCCY